jgi:ribose-phosphate pyrophosphokinase
VVRARALAKQLGCDLAIIDKRRPKANVSEVMHVIGDIEGRNCVIMDDMIDTAGTLVKAAEVLKQRGAKNVYAYCTHPIFGPGHRTHRQRQRSGRSGCDQHHSAEPRSPAVRQDSPAVCGGLLAETIHRISTGDSVSVCLPLKFWFFGLEPANLLRRFDCFEATARIHGLAARCRFFYQSGETGRGPPIWS